MPETATTVGMAGETCLRACRMTHTRTTGDQMQLTKPGTRTLVVPNYDELPTFILRGLLRTAGMTVEEFLTLL